MEAVDLAWAAGFLDGEGCFHLGRSVTRRGDKAWPGFRSYLKANQTAPLPIQRLYNLFGGRTWERGNRTVTGKRVYEWQITSAPDLRRVLPLIIPYLTVKREQAQTLFEFATTFTVRAGRKGTSSEVVQQRQMLFDRYELAKEQYGASV